jgi:methylated-DNA-[protein]-cysteine S-methyltransferase
MESGIYARESSVLGRGVQIGLASGRVIDVSFPQTPPADAGTDHPLLDRVFDYLDGTEDHFDDVEIAMTVPTEQRRVLEKVRTVPYGRSISVSRLARLAGFDDEDEDDVATVEAALRENPIPLFVPDHRVDARGTTPPDVASTLREIEGL